MKMYSNMNILICIFISVSILSSHTNVCLSYQQNKHHHYSHHHHNHHDPKRIIKTTISSSSIRIAPLLSSSSSPSSSTYRNKKITSLSSSSLNHNNKGLYSLHNNDISDSHIDDIITNHNPNDDYTINTINNNNNNNTNDSEIITLFDNVNDNDEFINILKTINIKKPYGLSYKEKQFLSTQLLSRIKLLSPKSVASATWCIGTLKIPRRGHEVIVISDMLIDQLTLYKSKLTSEEVSIALVGLARLGIKMSIQTSNTFLDILPRVLPIMSEHDISNAVWAMGKIGILWDNLPLKIQKALGLSISQKSIKMTPQSIAITIHGLSNQRAKWESLPTYLRDSLEEALRRTVNTMKELEISNTISGLGRLGAQWINVPTVVRYALTGAFLRTIDELGSKGLTMSIHGLGRMNADFSNLPPSFRDSIMLAIHTIAPKMNPQEISNVIYGLGKMDVRMNGGIDKVGLSKKARNGLLDALTREAWQLNSQGIANSLWGFMLMDTNWHILPNNVQKCILQTVAREVTRMDEQQIGNTIFALSCMGLTWKEIPSTMRNELVEALEEKCSFLEPAGVVMTLLGFGKMQLTWSGIEPNLKNALSEAISRTLSTASDRTVSTTVHALATLNAKWNKLDNKLKTSVEEAIARSYWDLHRSVQSSSAMNLKKQSDFSDIISLLKLSEVPSTSSVPSQLLSKAKLLTLKSSKAAELLLSPISDITNVNNKNSPSTSILIPKSWSKKRTTSSTLKNGMPKKEDAVTKVGSQMHQNPLIYSLGQIGVIWDDLGFSSQTTLSNVIVSTIGTMNEYGVVNTLYGLSQVGAKWNSLRCDVRDAIQAAIQRISVDMGEKGVAVAVLSLAKIEVSWTEDLSEESKDALRLAVTQQAHYGEHALSSVLYGFGKMNRKWDTLNPVVRQTLKEAIVVCHLNDRCTPQGVANSLHGLAQMQAEWSSLSSSVRLALLKEVFKAVPHATVHQASSIILSLSKLGCKWDLFPVDLRQELSKQIIKFSSSMNEQNLSNTLFALGSMGIQWITMEANMKNALIASLSRTTIDATPTLKEKKPEMKKKTRGGTSLISSHPLLEVDFSKTAENRVFEMKAQGISMVIVGLGRLNAGWATIPLKLAHTLEKYVAKYAGEMSAGQLASTVGGLGKCMWRWSTLQEKTRKSLLAAITRVGPSFSPTDVSLVAHGLGSLGALWDELSVDVRQSLLQGARRVAKTGTPSEVAGVIFGLGLMECAWNKIAEKPRHDLTQGIIRVCSASSPNSIGTNSNNWLYSDSKSSKVEMCPQAAANLMYALSILVFDTQDSTTHRQLTEVHISLLDLISRIGIGKFSEAEREQILIYLTLLQTLVPAKQFYQKKTNFVIKAEKPRPEPSKLQSSVVQSLTEALQQTSEGLQVANEYSGFGGVFPVDATIFEGGKAVAFVEVDGPHHYIDGQLRRKDRLKESLYRSKYPQAAFTRVRFDQVKRLGSSYVGAEVAKYINIVKNHRCSNEDSDKEICGWVTRQTERELATALSIGVEDLKKLNVLRSFDLDNYDWG